MSWYVAFFWPGVKPEEFPETVVIPENLLPQNAMFVRAGSSEDAWRKAGEFGLPRLPSGAWRIAGVADGYLLDEVIPEGQVLTWEGFLRVKERNHLEKLVRKTPFLKWLWRWLAR